MAPSAFLCVRACVCVCVCVLAPLLRQEGLAQAEDCVVEVPLHHSVLHGLNCKVWCFALGSFFVFMSLSPSVVVTPLCFLSQHHHLIHQSDLTKEVFLFLSLHLSLSHVKHIPCFHFFSTTTYITVIEQRLLSSPFSFCCRT